MFKQYLVIAYYNDDVIFKKRFKSINNAIKVCSGFDNDVSIEIDNLVTGQTFSSFIVKDMIEEFVNSCDMEEY